MNLDLDLGTMRLDPRGQAPARAFLADLNYRAGRQEEAVAEWERIRRENPDHISTRLALAQHYEREGNPDAARAALREVLRINPAYRARGPGGRYFSERDARWLDQWLASLRASSEK